MEATVKANAPLNTEKAKALQAALLQIEKQFGKGTIMRLGEGEVIADKKTPFLRRIGLRDAKRLVVLLLLVFYASGLTVVLSMRNNVMVRISPVRAKLYREGADGTIYNTFRMTVANRQRRPAEVTIDLGGLTSAKMDLPQPLQLGAGETVEKVFEIAVPANKLPGGVNHFEISSLATPGEERSSFPMTFITPAKSVK